jgi:uncharacterized MAPEG superfamily protein
MRALPNTRAGQIDIAESVALELEDLGNAWLKVAEITSAEQAGRAQDYSAKLLRAWQDNETARKAEQKPWHDAIKRSQTAWGAVQTKLTVCRGYIEDKLRIWKQADQRRIDAERLAAAAVAAEAVKAAEEARKRAETPKTIGDAVRAEAAMKAADEALAHVAAIPERASVRGTLSGRASSLRTHWLVEIVEIIEVFLRYQDHPDLRACLQKLVEAEVRGMTGDDRRIEGCRITKELR